MSAERQFIVTRERATVTIREVTAGSCRYTWPRDAAWEFAKRLAAPAKRALHEPRRREARIFFVGLDMQRKEVTT